MCDRCGVDYAAPVQARYPDQTPDMCQLEQHYLIGAFSAAIHNAYIKHKKVCPA